MIGIDDLRDSIKITRTSLTFVLRDAVCADLFFPQCVASRLLVLQLRCVLELDLDDGS